MFTLFPLPCIARERERERHRLPEPNCLCVSTSTYRAKKHDSDLSYEIVTWKSAQLFTVYWLDLTSQLNFKYNIIMVHVIRLVEGKVAFLLSCFICMFSYRWVHINCVMYSTWSPLQHDWYVSLIPTPSSANSPFLFHGSLMNLFWKQTLNHNIICSEINTSVWIPTYLGDESISPGYFSINPLSNQSMLLLS